MPEAAKKLDLLPPDHRRKNRVRSRIWQWIAVACIMAGGVIGLTVMLRVRLAEVDKTLEPIRKQAASLQMQSALLADLTERARALQAEAEKARERARNQIALFDEPAWGGILHELGAELDEQVWINTLTINRNTENTAGGIARMRIQGNAAGHRALMRFVERMQHSPFLIDFELVQSDRLDEPRPPEIIAFQALGTIR